MVRGELAQDCRDTAARSLASSLRGAAALRRSASSDKAKLACSLESPYRRSSLAWAVAVWGSVLTMMFTLPSP